MTYPEIPQPRPSVAPGHPAGWTDDEGSTTAEFAMVTLAAVAFAGLLISILSSGDVRGMLMGLISRALSL